MKSTEPTVPESADGCERRSGHTHDEARASYSEPDYCSGPRKLGLTVS